MTDDITFCANECKNKKCRRHRSNIREPQYPHSFAYLEGTEYCEKKPTSNAVQCKRYTKANIEEKVNSFEKVITSEIYDEIIDNTPSQ